MSCSSNSTDWECHIDSLKLSMSECIQSAAAMCDAMLVIACCTIDRLNGTADASTSTLNPIIGHYGSLRTRNLSQSHCKTVGCGAGLLLTYAALVCLLLQL